MIAHVFAPVFALVALLPLALGAPPQASATMRIAICTDGLNRTVEVPIPGKRPALPQPCPAKACHAGCNRKQFDPSQ